MDKEKNIGQPDSCEASRHSTVSPRSVSVRRIARIFWYMPFVLVVPAFFAVGELIPDGNRGSSTGARRLNAFLAAILPVFGACWAFAVIVAACADIPRLQGVRKTIVIVGISPICVFALFVAVALQMGW